MAVIGDKIFHMGREYRFTAVGAEEAFVPWAPWGNDYQNTSLALAKLDVPIDGSLDERVITLQDTTADKLYIYTQLAGGYGASFDLSFILILDPDNPAVTESDMDTILGTKDIDTLLGMTSNSAQLESAVAGVTANTVVLVGINNAALTNALADSHSPNQDTGTTQDTFAINSDGPNVATLDASTLTASVNLNIQEINDNLDLADEFMPIRSRTIVQVRTLSADTSTFIISDIGGASTPFMLVYDSISFLWLSGVYLMQDGGTPIVSGPVAGTVYVFEESFWECIDATNEIFKITTRLPITAHIADDVLLANEALGGQIHSNDAAPGTVTLTAPVGVEGMLITLVKNDGSSFIFEDSDNVTVISNTSAETSSSIDLMFTGGLWFILHSQGTWV